MNPSSVRRAAERKEKRESQGAAMPVPVPEEPQTVPAVPAPTVVPDPDTESAPQLAPPATSRYDASVVPGESEMEFNQFVESLHNHYMPYDHEEQFLVAKLVEWRWSLRRRKEIFDKVEARLYAAQPDATKWANEDFERLMLAERYRAQAEEGVYRAKTNVEVSMQRRIEDYHFHKIRDNGDRRLELQLKNYKLSLWKATLLAKKAGKTIGVDVEPLTATKSAVAS